MRASINRSLDQFETLFAPEAGELAPEQTRDLINTLQLVQDAYLEVIQLALKLLMEGKESESHLLLQKQRDQLESTLARISSLIEEFSEHAVPLSRLIIEYLFTRARLVDELKMFPDVGLILLERLSSGESLDETILHMEHMMTGKQNLYKAILSTYARMDAVQDHMV